MALIDVFRTAAQAVPKAAQNALGTTPSSPAPNSVTQTSAGFSWVDPTTGKTVTINPASQGGYMTAFGQYAQRKADALTDYTKGLDADLAANNSATNTNFDNSQRQAYVDYMRKQKALPSQLQALGVSGGATESGLLNLYNNYGSEHAANEQQRAAELAANQRDRDTAYREYYQRYQEALADQEQTAINNQINEYKNDLVNFQNSIARYPTTEKGYQQYKDLIKSLKNGNDPLKDYKIAYVEQQMATQFPDGKPKGGGSSGSGGGGGGSRRRGSGSGSGGSGGSGGGGGSDYDYGIGRIVSTQKNLNRRVGTIQKARANSPAKRKYSPTAGKKTKKYRGHGR